MIKLTTVDSLPLFVVADAVVAATPPHAFDGDGVKGYVHLISGTKFPVKETPEEILKMVSLPTGWKRA